MAVNGSLELGVFYQFMLLFFGVQWGGSPTGRSGQRDFVRCVQQYCYCREKKYAPHDDPNDFAYLIQVKENAPDSLRRALSRALVGQVGTGDYQPREIFRKAYSEVFHACGVGWQWYGQAPRSWAVAEDESGLQMLLDGQIVMLAGI
jgi:hypothetical protein